MARPREPGTKPHREVWAAWTVWVVACGASLGFVLSCGLTVPFADQWQWVSQAGGAEPVTLRWLWSQHNEHRPLLARLVYVGLARLTDYDFRAPALLNVALLAAAAAAMMLSARALRGRASLADAFFPLMLLNWAQFINLLWGFQLCLVMSAVLVCAGLVAMLHARTDRWLWSAVAVMACFVGAALSAASGLAYLAAMTLWVLACAALGFSGAKDAGGRRADWGLAIVVVVLAGVLGAAYRVDFHMPHMHAPARALATAARTASEFLANAFGPVAAKTWPVSAIVVGLACALAAAQSLHQAWTQPARRVRAMGLFCFLLGTLGVAGAIGWSRSFLGPGAGFEPRYITLAVPLGCLFFLQSAALETPWSRRVEFALLLVAAMLLAPNVVKGLRGAACLQAAAGRLIADARAGVPPKVLAVRYCAGSGFANPSDLAGRLELLRRGRWGPYRGAADVPIRPALGIEPLAPLADHGLPQRTARLGPGDSLSGMLYAPPDVMLERVDLLARPRHRHGPSALRWQIAERQGSVCRDVASGQVDLAQLDYHEWLSIRLPAPAHCGRAPLELRLAVEAPASARPLEIPLYPLLPAQGGGAGFQGFLYFTPTMPQRAP